MIKVQPTRGTKAYLTISDLRQVVVLGLTKTGPHKGELRVKDAATGAVSWHYPMFVWPASAAKLIADEAQLEIKPFVWVGAGASGRSIDGLRINLSPSFKPWNAPRSSARYHAPRKTPKARGVRTPRDTPGAEFAALLRKKWEGVRWTGYEGTAKVGGIRIRWIDAQNDPSVIMTITAHPYLKGDPVLLERTLSKLQRVFNDVGV